MPRRPRIHAPGAFYHVTLRGNHRKPIFFCDADRELLNQIVATTLDRCQARLHAYCWMPNHVHMLLQVSDVPLGRVVLRIAGWYARSIQARMETTGHLFERRYHAVLVDADRYLLTLLRYIHLNPVRAGLAATASGYPWSSHHHYSGTRQEPWVTAGFALRMLDGNYRRAIARYRKLIDPMRNQGPDAFPLAELHPDDGRVLGDDHFLANLALPKEAPRPGMTLDELIRKAGLQFGLEPKDLLSASRDRRLSSARAWIAHEAVTRRVATTAQVARALHRDESTIRGLIEHHFPCRRAQQ